MQLTELMGQFFKSAREFLLGAAALVKTDGSICPVSDAAFLEAFQGSMRGCGIRFMLGPLRFLVPKVLTFNHWRIVHQYMDFYVELALSNRATELSNQSDNGMTGNKPQKPQSLLQNLAHHTDEAVEIRHQLIQAMMAAQDTTAALMSNTLFLLARNQAILARLRDEVASINTSKCRVEELKSPRLLHNTFSECTSKTPQIPFYHCLLGSLDSASTVSNFHWSWKDCSCRHHLAQRRRA